MMKQLPKTARALGLLAVAAFAAAWGPHRDITRAAFDTLAPDDPLLRFLGDEVKDSCELAWLPDWQESLITRKCGTFNANDYLLFPGMTDHPGHAGKGPHEAAGPYFRRALQAVRTETPENAARWISSLVHFPEDAGSPPHAHFVGGGLHHDMEHWVNGAQIRIAGYKPKVLGTDEASAVAGFQKRLQDLVDFSRPRGVRLEPIAKAGNRAAGEPIEMECAEECARTVADVLRTLSAVAFSGRQGGAGLEGRIESRDVQGLAKVPAKVILLGTPYSTLTDEQDRYVFRNLPPGSYTIAVLRAGNALGRGDATLSVGRTTTKDFLLGPAAVPGNLLRNSDFQVHWVQRDAPDGWAREEGKEGRWLSEAFPVNPGRTYRLVVEWTGQQAGEVFLRWQDTVQRRGEKVKMDAPLARDKREQVYDPPAGYKFARVVIRTPGDPSSVCVRVAVTDSENTAPSFLALSGAKPVILRPPSTAGPKAAPVSAAPARPPERPIPATGPGPLLPPGVWVSEQLAPTSYRPTIRAKSGEPLRIAGK